VVADRRSFLGTGCRFPMIVGADGSLGWSSGETLVAESIWLVLSTAPGDRVMEPEFGCGVHQMVFGGTDAATAAAVAHHVSEALVHHEPRIDVLDVRVEARGDLRNVLLVEIDYRVLDNNAVHNLVYPFYINEGER
jgi:phage baseplate assembly protein W